MEVDKHGNCIAVGSGEFGVDRCSVGPTLQSKFTKTQEAV
jgi:hypothetical protein